MGAQVEGSLSIAAKSTATFYIYGYSAFDVRRGFGEPECERN
jgi:hypothetical protein